MLRARLALAIALALPLAPARAQQVDRSTFYLIVAADTVTIERIERGPAEIRFDLFDKKSRSRIAFSGRLAPDHLVSLASEDIFASPTDENPALRVQAQFTGDSVGVERGGTTNWVRVGNGALPGMGASAALLEQSLLRARALGRDTVTIPLLLLPAGPSMPLTIIRRGPTAFSARLGGVTIEASLSPEGTLLGATIPSQNARFQRGPATSGPFPGTKSFAPPPGAPYSAQDVTIRTPAGITLRGTLTLPQRAAGARVPVVVTITGSGPQDRDGTIHGAPAYRPYYQLADTLGRRGIAVLRLDDRGAGSDVGPMTVTTADLADDIRAAVSWLRTRDEIDPRRIGLVGHSEGGISGPMVAAADSGIGALVIMAGAVSKGREIVAFQQRYYVDSMARLRGQQREVALAQLARNADSLASIMPWMKFFLDYDGRTTAGRVRAPVLILHGEKDGQVSAAEAEKIAAAVRAGGNRDVTARVFPGMNHLFLPESGAGLAYERLPSYVVNTEVMGTIAEWLVGRLLR